MRSNAVRCGRALTGAVLLALLAGTPGTVHAAAQTFNTALPVAEGRFVLREQIVHRRADGASASAERETAAWASRTVLGYGARSDLTVFTALPIVHKRLEQAGPGGTRASRSATGLGDARLFARYTAVRRDAPGRTFRLAPFAGVEMPTGRDDARDGGRRLPQPGQPGSGSWDGFGGVVATWQTLAYEIDVQAAYQANTEANGFEFGDVARLDGSVQYRVWPRELGAGVPGFLYTTLGANLIHRQDNEVAGRTDPDAGGTQLFLAPGLQYVTKRWVLEGAVQLPVAQDRNAAGLEDEVIARMGFRVNF